ncbi:hypothetical protein vBAcoSR7M_35 [Alteromonas phage vB_AcoS-R7M]|uniref:Uncharacterized protein n=1 Tax=Alteromonas phage vB_AcoS-R7M TaxID=2729541 RepID=A0A6M3YND7_9CAUD|nr:hypothetical protein HWD34_gp35 [Alteromonas phage vB_AcoS-R7M]QJI53357.1 hypothetical protein vBAcoSR7M_35 [Alteromonas phage vB_AcoS-R7M]
MEQVEKTLGRKPAQLQELYDAEVEELQYLWSYYIDILSSCSDGKLNYTELKAWSEVTGICAEPWEIDVIRTLNRINIKVMQDGRVSKSPDKD